jgi:drug/metabolite transporter (DMT)-like permease
MNKDSQIFMYIKLLLTAVFWGGTFIAGRVVAKDVGPYSAAFLRFAIASVFLLLLTWKAEGKLPMPMRRQILPVILLGMTGVFSYNVFFFKGLKIINAGRASLIIANNPVFIALLAAYFFKQKLHLIKVAGIIISVTGAIIVISRGNLTEIVTTHVGWGELYIFFCVISWVTFSLIGKRVLSSMSPLVSISYSSLIGTVALFIPAYFEGMLHNIFRYSTLEWVSIFYLGFFGTVLGFVWYYQGIKAIGPMKASQFINFVPVSAILLAFFFLKEPITPSLVIGGTFVIVGVYLTNTRLSAKSD